MELLVNIKRHCMFSDIAQGRSEVLGWKRTNGEQNRHEGRKRVLAIMAGILVARHLKTPEDLGDSRPGPRAECLIASAVPWAESNHDTERWRVRQFAGGTENDDHELRRNVNVGVAPGAG
jgi:hypothetical protein